MKSGNDEVKQSRRSVNNKIAYKKDSFYYQERIPTSYARSADGHMLLTLAATMHLVNKNANLHNREYQGKQIVIPNIRKFTSSRLPKITETLNVELIDIPSSFLALKRYMLVHD